MIDLTERKSIRGAIAILAHADVDGIASAARKVAYLSKKYKVPVRDIWITFCQPKDVNKVRLPLSVKKVYVVDIGANNENPQMTINFIKWLGPRLAEWNDHHIGWPQILSQVNNPELFKIDESARACTEIIEADGNPDLDFLVPDAIFADTRLNGGFSPTGTFIERVIKADQTDHRTLRALIWWLLGDEFQLGVLRGAERRYKIIEDRTVEIANAGYKITDNIARIDVEDLRGIDLTRLLLEGQNKAKDGFAMVVTLNRITIATYQEGVNLLEMFGLPSGAKRRISLPTARLSEVIERLQNFKPVMIPA